MRKSIYTPPASPPSLEEMEAEEGHTPVESLRIRTPDFSSQEDADRIYRKRRVERAKSRRCWARVYTGSLFTASWVGTKALCMSGVSLSVDSFLLTTLVSTAFTVGCLATYSLCKGMLSALPAPTATHEKSDYDEEESIGAHV